MIWLAVVGVLFSAISAYFYLRVIMLMYMYEPKQEFRPGASHRHWPWPWRSRLQPSSSSAYILPLCSTSQGPLSSGSCRTGSGGVR